MKKRVYILVVAVVVLLAVGTASVGATMGVQALRSEARATVPPKQKPKAKKKCKAPKKLVHGKCVKPKKK